jgi:hypothetical protein
MSAPKINVNTDNMLLLLAVGGGLYLLWQGIKAAGNAAKAGAQAVNDAAVTVVSDIGYAVGLPTTTQTLSDPRPVRWIIDHVGDFAASKWGTADAFFKAVFSLQRGDGDNKPPPAEVLAALGVAPASSLPTLGHAVGEFVTGGAGSISDSGPSFNDVANGRTDPYNPLSKYGG